MSSPDLHDSLRAARPVAPPELRARVQALAASAPAPGARPSASWRSRLGLRPGLLLVPACLVAMAAGVAGYGLAGAGSPAAPAPLSTPAADSAQKASPPAATGVAGGGSGQSGASAPAPAQSQVAAPPTSLVVVVPAASAEDAAAAVADAIRAAGGAVTLTGFAEGASGTSARVVQGTVPAGAVAGVVARAQGLGRVVSSTVASGSTGNVPVVVRLEASAAQAGVGDRMATAATWLAIVAVPVALLTLAGVLLLRRARRLQDERLL